MNWIPKEDQLPPPHQDCIALNSDGRIFRSRICVGMHDPFFTFPEGDKNASDTAPDWIDVTHWFPMPMHALGTRENPHNIDECKHGVSTFKSCDKCSEEAGKGNRIFAMPRDD